MTAAPKRIISFAWAIKLASPSLRDIELTIPLPCKHLSPAKMISHFEESTMIGMRAISGSAAKRFKKRTMAALPSIMPSSILISSTCAPPSTCSRATARAASKSPSLIMRKKALEPVTLVRSPILTKLLCSVRTNASRPANLSICRVPFSWCILCGYLCNGTDMFGCCSAAATNDIN